eukprot:Lithocolla_globosa_v1_NODE_248_length_4862_cov_4.242147.p6 type:complete len:106 gc:universal NODE_248_length_4862_cov_4.242147:599-282(-)
MVYCTCVKKRRCFLLRDCTICLYMESEQVGKLPNRTKSSFPISAPVNPLPRLSRCRFVCTRSLCCLSRAVGPTGTSSKTPSSEILFRILALGSYSVIRCDNKSEL